MLAKLEMKLSKTENMSYHMASAFHGALMEIISDEYAEELHLSRLHPYTQHLERRGEDWYWVVTALNERACDELIKKALLRTMGVHLSKKNLSIDIIEKNYSELKESEMAAAFYNEQPERFVALRLITPTAFKINGRYINYPDIRSIYSNLMNKYDTASGDEAMNDEETLEQLVQNTILSRYELKSTGFSLEGIKIPSFIGKMTLRINGTQTMCSLANMLFKFGEFSGIGIKTSLGMGAIRLEKFNKNDIINTKMVRNVDNNI